MSVRPGDVVRVVNHEAFPITIAWDSTNYELQPRVDKFVPAEAAFSWFGDPRSAEKVVSNTIAKGLNEWIPDRLAEVRRLRVKWGSGMGGDESTFEGVPVPNVSIYEVDSGEKIISVFDDPEGKSVMSASPTISDSEDLLALVSSLQRQIQVLQAQTGQTTVQDVADEDELPSDDDAIDRHFKEGDSFLESK